MPHRVIGLRGQGVAINGDRLTKPAQGTKGVGMLEFEIGEIWFDSLRSLTGGGFDFLHWSPGSTRLATVAHRRRVRLAGLAHRRWL